MTSPPRELAREATICAIQHLVPPDMRAVASALFLFINNLIGLGVGTLLIGRLSDGGLNGSAKHLDQLRARIRMDVYATAVCTTFGAAATMLFGMILTSVGSVPI